MLLEQIEQDAASLVPRAFQRVDARQVQIRLIEGGRNADALLEARDRFIATLRDQVEHSEIVQRLGINRAGLQRPLQIFVGLSVSSVCANTIPRL